MAEKKASNKERLREITASIEQGIKELFESEKYRNYLSTMSRFPSYSLNNTILIHQQMPDATFVAGYNRWRDQFERHVKKGERGITIIAPTPFKKKIEEQKIDPDTKAPMLDKDGKIIVEEKEIQISMFKPVKVFDVSQTEGKPLPQLASDLTGDVRQYDAFMEALRRAAPVPIRFEKLREKMDGYFSRTNQEIVLREGMSEAQTVSAAVHEMAHAILHNDEAERQADAAGMEPAEAPKEKDQNTKEVEAESISYAVCQYYGIQTGENSFGYIASWSSGKKLAELKASLETINKTAGDLITNIDRHFKEVCKERGIDLSAEEQPDKDPAIEETKEEDSSKEKELLGRTDASVAGEEKQEVLSEQERKPEGKLIDRIRDALYRQPSGEEAGFSINNGEQYLVIQTCADGYDYTFFDAEFHGEDGGQLDRPEIPIAEAVWELLQEEGLEQAEVSPYDFETLVEQGELTEQKRITAAIAGEIVQNTLVQNGLEDEVRITGIAVYQNLYGASTPLRYDILVGYEGEIHEEDFYDLLHEDNHSIGGYSARFNPITPRETGTLKEYVSRLREEHGEKAVRIDLPEASEQRLDEYPMPDTDLQMDVLEEAGYKEGDMLPLSKDQAIKLCEKDFTVYAIVDGGNAEMLFEKEEIASQAEDTIFAVVKEEWEQSPDFHEKIMERKAHQEEREQAFLSYEGDCFAIYQVKEERNTELPLRFMDLEWIKSNGLAVERANYDLIYTGALTAQGSTHQKLESLYEQFNLEHPADYHSPSLSVSDIVALKQDGMISCHYCDSVGFQEIPGFLPGENYLKSAEMAMEDDYGMIDGIINNGPKEQPTAVEQEAQAGSGQAISRMELGDAVHREEQDKKKSVVEQLKNKPDQKQKKTAPRRSAEREI